MEDERKRKIYQELPETFQLKDAIKIGVKHGTSPSTIKRWLKSTLFESLEYGKYCKVD